MKTLEELTEEVIKRVRVISPSCPISDMDIAAIAGTAMSVMFIDVEAAAGNTSKLAIAAQEVVDEYNSRRRIHNDRLYHLIETLNSVLQQANLSGGITTAGE